MHWYDWLNSFVLTYFFLLNGSYLLMNVLAYFNIRRHEMIEKLMNLRNIFRTRFYKPITIMVPAYNEEQTIISSLSSLLSLDYPQFEVIVVNDGSKDSTLQVLIDYFQLIEVPVAVALYLPTQKIKSMYISLQEPRLKVLDKENGGKADALNAAINASSYPLICTIDADSILERDGLLKVVRPFIEDERTIAVGGIVRIANGCEIKDGKMIKPGLAKNWLATFQVVEYLRAFLFGRMGWDALNILMVISGAFGLFDKKTVIAAGGYRHDTVGEDMELVVRLHKICRKQKKPYRIRFVPDPVCWTEVPENLKMLGKQRSRWQKGLADSIMKNREMLLNPEYGWIGMFAFPFFFLFELLGPVVELGGFIFFIWSWAIGWVDWEFALLFFLVAVLLGVLLSVSSIAMEERFFHRYFGFRQVLRLFWFSILENLGYRQLTTLWRFRGLWQYLLGDQSWGEMSRKGFQEKSEE